MVYRQKIKTPSGVFIFWLSGKGIEGDRARHGRVKTLRGSVFRERAEEAVPKAVNRTDEKKGFG